MNTPLLSIPYQRKMVEVVKELEKRFSRGNALIRYGK